MVAMNFGPLSCFCLKAAAKSRGEDIIQTSPLSKPYWERERSGEDSHVVEDLTAADFRPSTPTLVKMDDKQPNLTSGVGNPEERGPLPHPDPGLSSTLAPFSATSPAPAAKTKEMFEAGTALLGALVGGVQGTLHAQNAQHSEVLIQEHWPHAIVPNILSGKTIQASRMLAAADLPEGMMRRADIERIGRVASLFFKSTIKPSAAVHRWRDAARGIECSYHESGGVGRVESSAEIRGFDPVQALASLCELDCLTFAGTASPFQPLGKEIDQRADESLWRVVRDAERTDDIIELTCVNALEEDSDPMMWVSSRQVSAETGFQHSIIKIPPSHDGYRRVCTEPTQYRITLLEADPAENSSLPFRLQVVSTHKLSWASSMLHSLFPCCCFMGGARQDVVGFFDKFKDNLRNHGAALDESIAKGTRSSFYAQVRKSLKSYTCTL